MLKTLGLVAAVTLYIVNPAPAGPQAKTGDTCLPFDNNVVYKRDSGAIVNTGPGTQGFICPIQIIDNHCGNYCGDFYYQRQFHYASLGYTVPQGTTINCSPVTRYNYGFRSQLQWGKAKTGTESGELAWYPGEIFTLGSIIASFSLYCDVPAGGEIDEIYVADW
jgi:hypothetical protein